MKRFKKLVATVTAIALALSMGAVAAFGAGEGSITVQNPVAGQNYIAYKIFDVTYSGDSYAYSIDADSEWLKTVEGYEGISLSKSTDGNFVVSMNDKFGAAEFAAVLKGAVSGKTGVELAIADGKATATGLDLGYYFVTSTTGALCNLTTTNPAANINDKNDIPFDKVDSDDSVEVGQTVNYVITGKVPDTTGFTQYTYRITDSMSVGLTFNQDVKVEIGGAEIADATVVHADNGFTLDIPVVNYRDKIGAEIKVTYSALVNENAVAKVEQNKAQLEYTNGPDGSTAKTPEDVEKVYTAKLVIDKFASNKEDANDQTAKLAGAKFVLINNDTTDGDGDGIANDANTDRFYKYVDGKVTWVATQAEADVVTTDNNGSAEFKGLENGSYLLREVEAPAGYNMLTKDVEVTVSGTDADVTTLSIEADVANSTGAELPSTGGMGTTILYAVGAALVLGAGIALVVKRRMASSK